jgi:hypothetical protein
VGLWSMSSAAASMEEKEHGCNSRCRRSTEGKWPASGVLWLAEVASSPLPSPSCGSRIKSAQMPGQFGCVLVRLAASSPFPFAIGPARSSRSGRRSSRPCRHRARGLAVLTVCFGAPNKFITL